jgi:hypothetical protein
VPELRGRGVARALLHELESVARSLGYAVARLDTGPKQVRARGLYESEGYAEILDFNGNPVAVFWGRSLWYDSLRPCRARRLRLPTKGALTGTMSPTSRARRR